MRSNILNRTLLIYASLIAFLLGIAGSIIGNLIFRIYPRNLLVHILIIGLLFLLVYRLIQAISEVLGAGTLKSSQYFSINNPYELTINLEKKIPKNIAFRLRDESFFRELLGLFIQFHLAIIIVGLLCMFRYLQRGEHLLIFIIPFLIFFFLLLYFMYLIRFFNFKLIQLAYSGRSCIDFILRRKLFYDPKEYHLIIDFERKCYFFTYHILDKDLEREYKKIINESINNKENEYIER